MAFLFSGSPRAARDCLAFRHPGQVCLRRTRAGIQEKYDYIGLFLDSGSRPAKRSSSGMTKGAIRGVFGQPHGGFCLEVQLKLHEIEVREGAELTLELRLSGGTLFRAVTKIDTGSNEDFGVVRWRPGQDGLNLAGRIFP
jgi:hypothetical protein